MTLYELTANELVPLEPTTFASESIRERDDLQRILRTHIEVIAPGCLVLAEEFCEWSDSRRRIDLLCLDKDARLVVVELKRNEHGGAMELQAIRYAAMVSTMTFEAAVLAHARFREATGVEGDARAAILDHLGWASEEEGPFASDVSIVLVGADFSRELLTSVLWLNERDLDIRCVRLRPHQFNQRVLLDVEQVVPLPEASDYLVRVREKEQVERKRLNERDFTKYEIVVDGRLVAGPLNKRRAALEFVRQLVGRGVQCSAIESVAQKAISRQVLSDWSGRLDSEQIRSLANESASVSGVRFDERRWFLGDDELFHGDGKTYALTNQWGWRSLQPFFDACRRSFPQSRVEARAVDES